MTAESRKAKKIPVLQQVSRQEVIIESPFITKKRTAEILPILRKLKRRGVQIVINTRHPDEHDEPFSSQARAAIMELMAVAAALCRLQTVR